MRGGCSCPVVGLQAAVQREPQEAAGRLELCLQIGREAGALAAGSPGSAAQPPDGASTQPVHESTEVQTSSSSSARLMVHGVFTSCLSGRSLRYLNVSANKLESLPAASQSEDVFSSVQELYATNNGLTDKCVPLLMGHAHLRVLHLAFNQLQTFTAR